MALKAEDPLFEPTLTESSHNYCAEKINNKILLITTTMKLYDTTTEPTRLPSLGEQTLRQNLPLRGKLTDGNERDMKGETEGRVIYCGDAGKGLWWDEDAQLEKSLANFLPSIVQAPLSWKE